MVERQITGDRHGERPLVVGRFDLLDQRLRLVVVEEGDRDDGRVAILRDERFAPVVEVGACKAERGDPAVAGEASDVGLELRRVDRVVLGADDDDVADVRRGIGRERRHGSFVGALRLRVVRRALPRW